MALPKDLREFIESFNCHGVDFVVVDGVPVGFLGYESLLTNKLATGRSKDAEDVARLKAIRASKRPST